MKTKLSFLFIFLFMFSINFVKADTIDISYSLMSGNNTFEENLAFYTRFEDVLSNLYDDIYQEYLTSYSDVYPYYFISYSSTGSCLTCDDETSYIYIYLYMYSNIPSTYEYTSDIIAMDDADIILQYSYSVYKQTYILPIEVLDHNIFLNPLCITYFYSNFDLILNLESYDSINISTYPSSDYTLTLSNGDIIPTTQDFFDLDIINDSNTSESTYVTVDLNKYSYIALSLKDYETIPESSYSTYVNFDIKGKLCVTPVYNYGQTERKDILTGTQIQACSEYYTEFTTVRFYILPDDVKNHAIYYLKSYDTTQENIVKIDSSVFNISYITEDNKDNPQVEIDGKVYPTLSYDSLTDTATKSEDEGYISGVTCAVGDLNCYTENNPENVFDSLFEQPLEMMKKIWSSITGIFDIITEFISLLPEGLQTCLYLSFIIALIIGLIKIIL